VLQDRKDRRVTQSKYAEELTGIFEEKFELNFKIPIVFIDSHYNSSVPEEMEAFQVTFYQFKLEVRAQLQDPHRLHRLTLQQLRARGDGGIPGYILSIKFDLSLFVAKLQR
jgi:hypothetical protein